MFDFFKKKEVQPTTLPYLRDLHSHIIPGVDDGSPDLETSLMLVSKMSEWGIRQVTATPHRTDVTFENSTATIEAPFNLLREAIKKNNIDIELNYSFEYRMDEGFIKIKDAGMIRPLKDNYVLVENSFVQPLWNLDQLIFDLKLKGFRPILAHPERYPYYHSDKSVYKEIHNMECDFQVNVLSLAGCYGHQVQDISMWMLKEGMLNFLSTDLHHGNHVRAMDLFLHSKEYQKLRPRLAEVILNDKI